MSEDAQQYGDTGMSLSDNLMPKTLSSKHYDEIRRMEDAITSVAKKLPSLPVPQKATDDLTLTQYIARDMRALVVQEFYDLAEGIVRVQSADAQGDEIKTRTIELMLTLNQWCRKVVLPGEA